MAGNEMAPQQARELSPADKAKSLRNLLEANEIQNLITKALPNSHANTVRMVQVYLTAMTKNPILLDCDRKSIISTLIVASQLGLSLDPVLGHAYPVPYWNNKLKCFEAQCQVGYKGYIQMMLNTGLVSKVSAAVVFEGDTYHWDEANNEVIHYPVRPSLRRTIDGNPIRVAAYARAWMKDGSVKTVWLWDEEVISRMGRSQSVSNQKKKKDKGEWSADTPWDTDPDAMWRKTAFRALASTMPLSPEDKLARALDIEASNDSGRIVRPIDPEGGIIAIDNSDFERMSEEAADQNPSAPVNLESKVTVKETPPPPPPEEKGRVSGKKSVQQPAETPPPAVDPAKSAADRLMKALESATGAKEPDMAASLKFYTKKPYTLHQLLTGEISQQEMEAATAAIYKDMEKFS